MNEVRISGSGERYAVAGELSFATVTASVPAPTFGAHTLTLDLREVTKADSAGLALLLDWQRRAQAAGGRLVLADAPERLQSLIRVYGLTEILAV